jgi:hypothetical protein
MLSIHKRSAKVVCTLQARGGTLPADLGPRRLDVGQMQVKRQPRDRVHEARFLAYFYASLRSRRLLLVLSQRP